MKPRILVVDDEPEAVELVEFNLKQAGYAVTTAADGDKENATAAGAVEKKRRKAGDTAAGSNEKGDAGGEKKAAEETAAVFVRNIPLEATEEELVQVHGTRANTHTRTHAQTRPRARSSTHARTLHTHT